METRTPYTHNPARASVVPVPKTKRSQIGSRGPLIFVAPVCYRTPQRQTKIPLQSHGAPQNPARLATLCRRLCRDALRGSPSAQPVATRAPQCAPPPPAGRTRRHRGPRARPAARAAPRAHCGLLACTESGSRMRLGRWRSVPEPPREPAAVAHGLLSAAGWRLRSPGVSGQG